MQKQNELIYDGIKFDTTHPLVGHILEDDGKIIGVGEHGVLVDSDSSYFEKGLFEYLTPIPMTGFIGKIMLEEMYQIKI